MDGKTYLQIVILAPAVLLVLYFVWLHVMAVKSKSWPRTEGKMLYFAVEEIESIDPTYCQFSARVEVSYEYTVRGVKYTSNRFSFRGNGYATKAIAQMDLFSVLSSEKVIVYYKADNPKYAVLIPG